MCQGSARRGLKVQLKLRDGDAALGEYLDRFDDQVCGDDDDEADDGVSDGSLGHLKLLLIAAGEEKVEASHNQHDKEPDAGERQHALDEIRE